MNVRDAYDAAPAHVETSGDLKDALVGLDGQHCDGCGEVDGTGGTISISRSLEIDGQYAVIRCDRCHQLVVGIRLGIGREPSNPPPRRTP